MFITFISKWNILTEPYYLFDIENVNSITVKLRLFVNLNFTIFEKKIDILRIFGYS